MAYDFDPQPFDDLDALMRDFPDGIRDDRDTLERLAVAYLNALVALLRLMRLIMAARLPESHASARYRRFLPIYDMLAEALLAEMRAFLLDGLAHGELADVHEFLEGTRRGAIALELAALGRAIEASSGEGTEAEADEAAGTTVTNSLKEHIERRVRRKWIKDILHGINEILAVARGVT